MDLFLVLVAAYLGIGLICACVVSLQIYRQFIPIEEIVKTFIAVFFLWFIFAFIMLANWLFNGGRR